MKKLLAIVLLLATCTSCSLFDHRADNAYAAAMKRWNAGDYPAAVRMYLELVREYPDSSRADEALYWAGVTQFLYLGETDKALRTLRLLLRTYPDSNRAAHAQWYIAQIYDLGNSDCASAIPEYRKAAAYSNREVREKSLYGLADCLSRVNKVGEALTTWQQEVTEFPRGQQTPLAYFRMGTAAFATGAINRSETCYRKAIALNPDPSFAVKAKFALAETLEFDGQLEEALALYQEIAPAYSDPDVIQIKIKAIRNRMIKKRY